MSRHALLVLALTLVSALPATASAQDQAVIHMKSGDIYEGLVLADDGKQITFRTNAGLELGLPYKDMSPATVYQLDLGRVAPGDAQGELMLGDEAAAADLWASAKRHYHLALAADPSLAGVFEKKMTALREDTAGALLAQAKLNIAQGEDAGAAKHLAMILTVVPNTAAASQASQMLDTLHARMSSQRTAQLQATQSREIQEALQPAEQAYQQSVAATTRGLQAGTNQQQAINEFQNAIQLGTSGRDALKSLQSQQSNDPGMAPAIKHMDDELVQQIINADIQLANVYNQRSSYNDANGVVNSGLALEPTNEQLLSLRNQIASNSAAGSDCYGAWTGGRGGPIPTPYRR